MTADEQPPSGEPGREPDVDERFAQIVSRWDDEAPEPSAPRLAWERQSPARPADDEVAADAGPRAPGAETGGIPSGWITPDAGWRAHLPAEPDEHFEPPEPALPPAHDATYWLAVAGLGLGPLVVLWAVVSGNPDPGWLILAGVGLIAVGFGLLVLRGSGDDQDPDDDGARV